MERIGSDLAGKPFSEFTLFQAAREDAELKTAFMKMQDIYVFFENDILQPEFLWKQLEQLKQTLLSLGEGLEIQQGNQLFTQQLY